jgi:hypothetical protein
LVGQDADDRAWFFSAPPHIVGGLACASTVSFRITHPEFDSKGREAQTDFDVVVVSRSLKLSLGLKSVIPPWAIMTEVSVSLDGGQEGGERAHDIWINTEDFSVAAQHLVRAVIKDASALLIRGSYYAGAEVSCIETFLLTMRDSCTVTYTESSRDGVCGGMGGKVCDGLQGRFFDSTLPAAVPEGVVNDDHTLDAHLGGLRDIVVGGGTLRKDEERGRAGGGGAGGGGGGGGQGGPHVQWYSSEEELERDRDGSVVGEEETLQSLEEKEESQKAHSAEEEEKEKVQRREEEEEELQIRVSPPTPHQGGEQMGVGGREKGLDVGRKKDSPTRESAREREGGGGGWGGGERERSAGDTLVQEREECVEMKARFLSLSLSLSLSVCVCVCVCVYVHVCMCVCTLRTHTHTLTHTHTHRYKVQPCVSWGGALQLYDVQERCCQCVANVLLTCC